jgi:hypothetical protein
MRRYAKEPSIFIKDVYASVSHYLTLLIIVPVRRARGKKKKKK